MDFSLYGGGIAHESVNYDGTFQFPFKTKRQKKYFFEKNRVNSPLSKKKSDKWTHFYKKIWEKREKDRFIHKDTGGSEEMGICRIKRDFRGMIENNFTKKLDAI